MIPASPQNLEKQTEIRSLQHRDLDVVEALLDTGASSPMLGKDKPYSGQDIRQWFGVLKLLSLFPNLWRYKLSIHVAEQRQRSESTDEQVVGVIEISPFNRTRSTWRVDRVGVKPGVSRSGIGSLLLRYCMQAVREARTWLLEVDVNEADEIALYRQNGFQPLAHMTYWAIAPEQLAKLAQREPDLPNLLPVSNADAGPLYQLDTVAMPPFVRQVFDRHVDDFKTPLLQSVIDGIKQWWTKTEVVSGYVFETQRQAAIGYFQLHLQRQGEGYHQAELTVHPAYTWLYPELMAQMARITQEFSPQPLYLASADYQPEREEHLQQIGASRIGHTLMMSRSVWHKLRESKLVSLEGLQLSDMLQGLQPAGKPIPGRMSILHSLSLEENAEDLSPGDKEGNGGVEGDGTGENGSSVEQ
ncbi:MAG: GNAT family N-acetyltransferase [Roseofilum sp. SBFL]|uniref:GNAT family N-acetyltransferase n=1 Tax=unclassified Roseofilum TaxID=2620099 RepID=UPI001B2AF6B8|nr:MULTISPECIES: GNAT family N-acetyltransferase [unclassified Roseofilum]MBP0012501.1 GNAT family N-acetyltransferase [Roseofilum sp. SID3]MBP0024728.1 GNAT family N-acetyltransferase [Roseofilum sp. SID2]MBP0037590.1 GNAT family N-acetyltransferase [Roseofilum sp. SID1]MBP0041852.1 GNAT family N-acetyltransferase [Roseofilum sp. SBFL]